MLTVSCEWRFGDKDSHKKGKVAINLEQQIQDQSHTIQLQSLSLWTKGTHGVTRSPIDILKTGYGLKKTLKCVNLSNKKLTLKVIKMDHSVLW